MMTLPCSGLRELRRSQESCAPTRQRQNNRTFPTMASPKLSCPGVPWEQTKANAYEWSSRPMRRSPTAVGRDVIKRHDRERVPNDMVHWRHRDLMTLDQAVSLTDVNIENIVWGTKPKPFQSGEWERMEHHHHGWVKCVCILSCRLECPGTPGRHLIFVGKCVLLGACVLLSPWGVVLGPGRLVG